ncbi:hypothetical protein EVG20_g7388 [Dentipellis fragilis]|uniref:Uncharacterized protein n=1 Tax=Dentipellis fragilis TaxID=205917 RepID=A0A4Y9YFN3_9AGAM|nr:hypothetical protein EVG20_g7388 [Dentipellis fragilis]
MTMIVPEPETTSHDNFGFPAGYFVIRSLSSGRLLDVSEDLSDDGTEIILWPEKEKSLVETFRGPESNNQVFFIDVYGALCSRDSGHAIDIEGVQVARRVSWYANTRYTDRCTSPDGRLVLRHRRPISKPYPNAYSHPLPQFHFSAQSGELTATFETNPEYPAHPTNSQWRVKSYHVTAMPMRKPRTFLDDASEALTSALRSPLSLFSGAARPDTSEHVNEAFDLRPDELLEHDRGEAAEVDDSPEAIRHVRVIGMTEEEARGLGEKARNRRRWSVQSLRRTSARTA